jgi:hypothetical protein
LQTSVSVAVIFLRALIRQFLDVPTSRSTCDGCDVWKRGALRAVPVQTSEFKGRLGEAGNARCVDANRLTSIASMADKKPRHRFLLRDRFALAYARNLPLCFFFRQVEASFEPAVIELERHAEPASCLFREHLRANYFVHFQRHFAIRTLTRTNPDLLRQSGWR